MRTPTVTRSRTSYGWVIVAVSFVLLIGSFGTQMCFGLFLKPLTEQFGWSRAEVSGAMSLLMAVSGLVGVIMGRVTDRWGARAAIVPGVVMGAIGYFLASRMGALWEFYLWFGVGGGILAGCSYAPAVTAISRWFSAERRTMAIGIALLGPVVGQMVLTPIITKVIEGSGWRTAWWVLAIVAFVTGLPALVAIGKEPPSGEEERGGIAAGTGETRLAAAGLSTVECCKTPAFWILIGAGVALGLGFYSFAAHVVSYATDVGLSTTAAGLVLTVSSVGGACGTLISWVITAKLGYRWTLIMLTVLNGIAMFLYIAAGSVWSFYALAVVVGFAFSATVPVRMGVVPSLFGMRAVGTIIGFASLSFSVGAIAGPFLAGYIFDSTGSYDLAFIIFGVLLVMGAVSLHFLRTPKAMAARRAPSIWRAGDGLG